MQLVRERDADRTRGGRLSQRRRPLAVDVSFSELLRVFFVFSSERFRKGIFTLLRCPEDFWEKLEVRTRGIPIHLLT